MNVIIIIIINQIIIGHTVCYAFMQMMKLLSLFTSTLKMSGCSHGCNKNYNELLANGLVHVRIVLAKARITNSQFVNYVALNICCQQ